MILAHYVHRLPATHDPGLIRARCGAGLSAMAHSVSVWPVPAILAMNSAVLCLL